MKLVPVEDANKLSVNIFSTAKSRSDLSVDFIALNPDEKAEYVQKLYLRTVFYHQKEQLHVLTDPYHKDVTNNVSRQSGKSEARAWAQGLNAIHNTYPALDNTTKIIGLANKESQSLIGARRLRGLLEGNWEKSQFFWDKKGSTKTYMAFFKEAGVKSKLTGTIEYLTANPKAFGEGFTASIIDVDEAGRLDGKTFSEVVLPYGASTNARILLTGVSRGRGPFYDACNSEDYYHIHQPWDKVETYRKSAPVDLIDPITQETILETGMYPLNMMPLALKKALFPQNPICHILPTRLQKERQVPLWSLSKGKMTEEDFRSQFMLEWLSALLSILPLHELRMLFQDSVHMPLERGLDEEYYFGLDLGGTQNQYAEGDDNNKDKTALAIWTRRGSVKHKVFADELFSAQPEEIVEWLIERVHPTFGWFRCKYGGVDVTSVLGALASEYLVKSQLPIIPIMYNRTEETTRKNFKNAMFQYFKIENGAGRCKYPPEVITDSLDPDTLRPTNPCWFNSREEWEVIESQDKGGPNLIIGAPEPFHDDHPNADVMAVYVMDRPDQFQEHLRQGKKRARPLLSQGLASSPFQTTPFTGRFRR